MGINFGSVRERVRIEHPFNPEVTLDDAYGDFPHCSVPPVKHGPAYPNTRRDLVTLLLTALIIGVIGLLVAMAIWLASMLVAMPASARDDGRYANSPLKPWFDKLASGKGLCCSFADGVSIRDVDWDTQRDDHGAIHYRVRLNGRVVVVPDDALVTEPNRFGPAVVWPYEDTDGQTQIRCFIPGAGA